MNVNQGLQGSLEGMLPVDLTPMASFRKNCIRQERNFIRNLNFKRAKSALFLGFQIFNFNA